ncbi:glycosyltransferase [Flavobacterium sp. LPB0248]|uniref:glycosyltransferase n=1 Tax=Flavobacterium sp. LPB0248 TaxID=2614441 RepID=UPI0015A6B7F7|nr:glycosyltransferase [Flavobacterium sp. LPB0248]QLC67516.1 glycosyltransferase [Flavobacterium sp. LPB0248]
MKFAIITHVIHIKENKEFFGYGPYIHEMNIWLKYVDEVIIVAPLKDGRPIAIDVSYKHDKIDFRKVADFNFINFGRTLSSVLKLPLIFYKIFFAMKNADHIHLRCPGNMGLIGCFVQILFPKKIKTAKYAGNWDHNSEQPFTYKIQKWILSNTFLTRNMEVLVYGNWKYNSKNIKPFFTASYSESEKGLINKPKLNPVAEFMFVGSLVSGKRPIYAIKLIEGLVSRQVNVSLNIYGDGSEREEIQYYIEKNNLTDFIYLHGNQNRNSIKKAYQKSHFVILPSKSEGWPKAIAEGMFWGCVPLATKVSCIPYMLDSGKRGILLEMDLTKDVEQIKDLMVNQNTFLKKSQKAMEWSRNFTTDVFEKEIAKLLMK